MMRCLAGSPGSRSFRACVRTCHLLLALSGAPAVVTAQPMALDGPPAPRVGALPGSPTARALEMIDKGDTTAAVDFLQASVRRQFKDASAWHLLGLLRWARIAEVRGQAYVGRLDQIKEIAAADSSLRIATQLAPDSARYWLSLARFNIRSPYSTTLYASQWNARSAYNSAKANGEVDLLALAADLRGMTMWRRYEAVAHRGFTMEGQSISDTALRNVPRDKIAEAISSVLVRPKTFTGLVDYTGAIDRFTEATEYEPTSQRYARHLFMALVERGQWPELLSVATRRAQTYPFDHSSRMARGLALHRLLRYDEARAAFDSAFVLMDDTEREWLTSLTRILKQRASTDPRQQGLDSVSYRRMTPAQQQAFAQMFWFLNDDVSLSGTSIHHLEFLARVTYADLRFTDEDRGLRGAATDRGDVYIRYGPPDDQYTQGSGATVALNWVYFQPKALFSFFITSGFGSARFSQTTRTEFEYLTEGRPVSWSNVRARAPLDTIPLHIARFRGSRDSTDVVVAARVPLDSLLGNVEMDELPVLLRVKAMDAAARTRTIDSAMQTVVRPVAAPSREQSWRLRADSGASILRVEALQPDVDRAARALSVIAPLSTRGFDMSDIMLGTPPGDLTGAAASAPRRWHDAGMSPRTGLLGAQRVLGLLWEVYEPSVRDGAMQYHVDITLRPIAEPGTMFPLVPLPELALGLKLVEKLGRAIKQRVSPGGISISYERAPPVPPDGPVVSVEYLSIDLSNMPKGRYELTVTTEDPVTKKRSARTSNLVLP
jgi:GWxTD domain-containing protein